MTKRKKNDARVVGKPVPHAGGYKVSIFETRSPFAKELETHQFSSRESAYQGYRAIKKEIGAGF